MSFRLTYDQIRELVRRVVLTPAMAKAILRKSGFRAGGVGKGLPPGGLKGYAVVKKSDEDYDVWWAPNGPYTYDWDQMPYPRYIADTGSGNSTIVEDGPPIMSVEPAPVSSLSYAHINKPLRSGTNNQGSLGFQRTPWGYGATSDFLGAVTSTWRRPSDVFSPSGFREGAIRGEKGVFPLYAPREYRLQAYITRCSQLTIWVYTNAMSVNIEDPQHRYDITSTGYFDSGWVEYNFATEGFISGHNYGRMQIEIFDADIPDPACPFFDIQVRTMEMPPFFDWMYTR